MVRWDSPLFTVSWTDADVPADDIWRAATAGIVKPPNTGTQAVRIHHSQGVIPRSLFVELTTSIRFTGRQGPIGRATHAREHLDLPRLCPRL
jgi:tRNA uridine 5-carbamoylmethylation protein Kti12